jgi:hypothetical protein
MLCALMAHTGHGRTDWMAPAGKSAGLQLVPDACFVHTSGVLCCLTCVPQALAFKSYHHVPLYLEWAPRDIFNTPPPAQPSTQPAAAAAAERPQDPAGAAPAASGGGANSGGGGGANKRAALPCEYHTASFICWAHAWANHVRVVV